MRLLVMFLQFRDQPFRQGFCVIRERSVVPVLRKRQNWVCLRRVSDNRLFDSGAALGYSRGSSTSSCVVDQ